MERYRLQEWLNFITSELHKGFGALFNPAMPEEAKALCARRRHRAALNGSTRQLAGKQYLMGDEFSVADAYLFTVTNWTQLRRHRHLRPGQPERLHGARRARARRCRRR